MQAIFEIASRISTKESLAAFAIAAIIVVLSLIAKKRGKVVPWGVIVVLVVVICLLGAAPYLVEAYLQERGIYRVRVTVLDLQGIPTNEAMVTSSLGGEPKRVQGGWQFDIPVASKPVGGKMTIYAAVPSAFLKGQSELTLDKDLHPSVTVRLLRDTSARVRGIVLDRANRAMAEARVGVVGYEAEAVTTGQDGNFDLPAHAAQGQQVQLYARKTGYKASTQWAPAGNHPVMLVLERD